MNNFGFVSEIVFDLLVATVLAVGTGVLAAKRNGRRRTVIAASAGVFLVALLAPRLALEVAAALTAARRARRGRWRSKVARRTVAVSGVRRWGVGRRPLRRKPCHRRVHPGYCLVALPRRALGEEGGPGSHPGTPGPDNGTGRRTTARPEPGEDEGDDPAPQGAG